MMKKNLLFIKTILLLLIVTACSKDDDGSNPIDRSEFAVAFENPSVSFSDDEETKEIKVVFSRPAPEAGTAVINYMATNTAYSEDFTTVPSGETGTITVNIKPGTEESIITFNKPLKTIDEIVEKSVTFSLVSLSYDYATISGNTDLIVSYTETPALGGAITAEIGGHNEPNQVYVDLSSQEQTVVKRDAWDLGFYSGDEFRVKLNGSLYMAVAELESTDIDAVTEADVEDIQPLVALGAPGTDAYVDGPTGDITQTAIDEISSTDDDNKVYLLNLGNEIGTDEPEDVGGVVIAGESRGWKKIRILKDGDDYILQYADLDATTHEEITISKNSDYNFTFYSFNTNEIVNVEPENDKWDLNFTVFTNILDFGGGVGGAYGFSDFVVNNVNGGVQAYSVNTEDFAYADFDASNVDSASFSEDQRAIGSNWRSVFTGTTNADVFFVLKDSFGNIYKIRFTALVNESGVRGYPSFEYTLLQ